MRGSRGRAGSAACYMEEDGASQQVISLSSPSLWYKVFLVCLQYIYSLQVALLKVTHSCPAIVLEALWFLAPTTSRPSKNSVIQSKFPEK